MIPRPRHDRAERTLPATAPLRVASAASQCMKAIRHECESVHVCLAPSLHGCGGGRGRDASWQQACTRKSSHHARGHFNDGTLTRATDSPARQATRQRWRFNFHAPAIAEERKHGPVRLLAAVFFLPTLRNKGGKSFHCREMRQVSRTRKANNGARRLSSGLSPSCAFRTSLSHLGSQSTVSTASMSRPC